MANSVDSWLRRGRLCLSLASSVLYLGRNIARLTNDYWPNWTSKDDIYLEEVGDISEKLRLLRVGLDVIETEEFPDPGLDSETARSLLEEFNAESDDSRAPFAVEGGHENYISSDDEL